MSDVVTIRFPNGSGTQVGTLRLAWVRDKSLHYYLKDPAVRPFGLAALSLRCYMYNRAGSKVRLPYVPVAGDVVTFVVARRA